MSHSAISLGLGLGGGKSATSSGGGGGGGVFTNGASVDFDGADDYATPASTITLSGNKSITFWAYFDTVTGQKAAAGRDGVNYYTILFNGSSSVVVRFGATPVAYSVPALSATTWTHFAFTGDNSDFKLYINGSEAASGTDYGDVILAIFGSINTSGYGAFNGKIDEFACFNSTLSPSDVATIANAGGASGSKGIDLSGYSPVHWWRMGDINGSSGATIADQGSGGVAMTLVNSPAYSTDVP